MPFGRTSTATPGPAILRRGAAATSLTADQTTGRRLHPTIRSSTRNPGAAYPHNEWIVITAGMAASTATGTAAKAKGETTPA